MNRASEIIALTAAAFLAALLSGCGGDDGGGAATAPVATIPVPAPPPVAVGPVGEVKLTGASSLPVVQLSSLAPLPGQSITVSVAKDGATAIAVTTSGSGCGSIGNTATVLPGATYSQTGAVGSSGQCIIEARVSEAAGSTVYTNEFTVAPSTLVGQGLDFVGGSYFPSGDIQLETTVDASIASVAVPQSLINGGTGTLLVTMGSGAASSFLVQIAGVPGYYVVPPTLAPGSTTTFELSMVATQSFLASLPSSTATLAARQELLSRVTAPQSSKEGMEARERLLAASANGRGMLTATVRALGTNGSVSAPAVATIPTMAVGTGPIQVSLTWAAAVDVDLHVVTPAGVDIFYGRRSDSTGGSLDLDSNAGCSIDNVDNENIVWPSTSTPGTGTYTVRVDYWSKCGSSSTIPYTVRVTNCGVSNVYSGSFNAADADAGGSGSGRTLATFNHSSCSGFSVAGKATYDDYVPTSTGLSTSARQLPIRHALVEVRQSSNDAVLATSETDDSGAYSMNFSLTPIGKYYVKVTATAGVNSPWLKQKVVDSTAAIYAIRSVDQDASITPNVTGLAVAAQRSGKFAEAFNIFDVGLNAFLFVKSQGQSLPALTWRWTSGVATCGGAASCYQSSDDSIYVLSTSADSDEYDDSVLAHEFGHFYMKRLSSDVSPGGAHSLSAQVVPTLAWSEGVATFFGQWVLHSTQYVDTTAGGAFTFNVETVGSSVPVSTSDGSLSGNVSEAIVTAVLWDLADSSKDSRIVSPSLTVTDKVAKPSALFSSLRSLAATTHDRGQVGVDVVDFLDQWLCGGYSPWDSVAGDNFRGVVTLLNQFPYTPATSPSCQ